MSASWRDMARASLAAVVAGFVLASPSLGEGAAFRTVVIFGDTQDLVDYNLADSGLGGLQAMVDWVLEHRPVRERGWIPSAPHPQRLAGQARA